jgi:hypothetical protein
MPDRWDLSYDLRQDLAYVRQVQDASSTRPGYGFPTTPYLFGSDAWWAAVDAGAIERRSVDGVITAVYWGSMGDWPEFRMSTPEGYERTWTRQGDLTRYVEGLRVRVDYVTLDRKPDAAVPELGATSDVVIAISIETSLERTPLYEGYRGSRQPDDSIARGVHTFGPSQSKGP